MMSKLGKLMEVYNILTWLTRLLISDLAGFENNIQYITLIDTPELAFHQFGCQ